MNGLWKARSDAIRQTIATSGEFLLQGFKITSMTEFYKANLISYTCDAMGARARDAGYD
jgi:hypothetical protein